MGEVRPITDFSLWDDFVESSPQGTIFSRTAWLKLFDAPYKIMGYFKGNNLMGGFACFDAPQPLTPFQGILVAPIEGKYTTIMSLHNEVAKALMSYLPNEFYNHYTYPDIRPFRWAGWSVDVRYTYVVSLSSQMEVNLEKDTRYEAKKSCDVSATKDIEHFCELYADTFRRKGLTQPVSNDLLRKVWERFGYLMVDDDEATVVFIQDSKRAYYILGASSGAGDSSSVLWQGMLHLREVGFQELDLVGSNSEKIGLFKRGFGGLLTPYFGVKRRLNV